MHANAPLPARKAGSAEIQTRFLKLTPGQYREVIQSIEDQVKADAAKTRTVKTVSLQYRTTPLQEQMHSGFAQISKLRKALLWPPEPNCAGFLIYTTGRGQRLIHLNLRLRIRESGGKQW